MMNDHHHFFVISLQSMRNQASSFDLIVILGLLKSLDSLDFAKETIEV